MGACRRVERWPIRLISVVLGLLIVVVAAHPAGASVGRQIEDPWRDDFADGRLVREQLVYLGINTTGGTRQPCEPRHAGTRGGASMWIRWRSSQAGTVFLNTNGSEFDSVIAVYTGNDLCHLTEVASDNDSGAGTNSRLSFRAGAGRVYRIVIDDRRGRAGYGSFRLRRE